MTHRQTSTSLPAQPFFATEQQRLVLARERFFENGDRPTGLVSEGVIQSWYRCVQAHRNPHESLDFNPVTRSRIHSVLSRNRALLSGAAIELMQLENTLGDTACHALLTDANGVLIHATRSTADHDRLLPLICRVGVNLAEDYMGTTAPGIVVRTGQPSTVRTAEHFFDCMQMLQCAAAPIRDIHQQVVGVLDLSIESHAFDFDAASMVALYATSIENRLLQAQSLEHIVVRLQAMPTLLGTPMEGLAGVNSDGMLAWVNGAAARLLGIPQVMPHMGVSDVFGLKPIELAVMTRRIDATKHQLPNGLTVWMLVHMQSADGAKEVFSLGNRQADVQATVAPEPAAVAPVMTPASPTNLRESEQHLVERTLAEHGGNVSKAARALGVSRGLIYRHLNRLLPAPENVTPP